MPALRRGLHTAAHSLRRFWADLDKFAAFVDAELAQAVMSLSMLGLDDTRNVSHSLQAMQLFMLCSTHSYLVFKTHTLLEEARLREGGEARYGPLADEASSRGRAELKRMAALIKVSLVILHRRDREG